MQGQPPAHRKNRAHVQAGLLLRAQEKALYFAPGGNIVAKRIGVIGIVIDEPKTIVDRVNTIISDYSHIIIGRMGVPRHEENVGVIALIIEGTTDEVGALTGRLGNLPGVTVKSALTARSTTEKGEKK